MLPIRDDSGSPMRVLTVVKFYSADIRGVLLLSFVSLIGPYKLDLCFWDGECLVDLPKNVLLLTYSLLCVIRFFLTLLCEFRASFNWLTWLKVLNSTFILYLSVVLNVSNALKWWTEPGVIWLLCGLTMTEDFMTEVESGLVDLAIYSYGSSW